MDEGSKCGGASWLGPGVIPCSCKPFTIVRYTRNCRGLIHYSTLSFVCDMSIWIYLCLEAYHLSVSQVGIFRSIIL